MSTDYRFHLPFPPPQGSYGGHGSRRNYDGQSVRRQQDNIYGRRPLPKSSSSRRHTVEQGLLKRINIEELWETLTPQLLKSIDSLRIRYMYSVGRMYAAIDNISEHFCYTGWQIFWSSSSARSRCTTLVCTTSSANSRNSSTLSTPFRDLGWWHVRSSDDKIMMSGRSEIGFFMVDEGHCQ